METTGTQEKMRPPRFGDRLTDRRRAGLGAARARHGRARKTRADPDAGRGTRAESPGASLHPKAPRIRPRSSRQRTCRASEEDDQSICDPDHPADKPPGNTPPPIWFDDMAYRMYELRNPWMTWPPGLRVTISTSTIFPRG